jgi:paraquat-inducible protein B
VLTRLVEHGLRAQLGVSNLLTGQLQIDLDMHPSEPAAKMIFGGTHPEIPTIPTQFAEITKSVASVIAKIERLPLDEIATEVRAALGALREAMRETGALAASVNEDVTPALAAALAKLDGTLAAVESVAASDAPLQREMQRTLRELAEAARSIRLLTEYLDQHPEALLRGKTAP